MRQIQFYRFLSIFGSLVVGMWLPLKFTGMAIPFKLDIDFDLIVSFIAGLNIYIYARKSNFRFGKLKFWLNINLVLDIYCFIPLSALAIITNQTLPGWLVLSHLLILNHLRHIKPFLDEFDNLQPITYRLIPLVITLPLLVHLVACGWLVLGNGSAGIENSNLGFAYVQSLYWAFTTLTTVGYGDIVAKTAGQMLYASGTQVIGVGVFGFILSNVASLLSRRDAAREHHMDNLDKVETFMKINRIPDRLRLKIRSYYHYLWVNKKGYQDHSLLDGLPEKIQSELFLHINKSIIHKVPFLKEASPEMIEDLMTELRSQIFVPGEKIFKIDEPGDALYFIHNGSIAILNRDGTAVAQLHEGAFFGEMALASDSPRNATAMANTFCDTYVLSRDSFLRVAKAYPEFKSHIEEIMRQRKSA